MIHFMWHLRTVNYYHGVRLNFIQLWDNMLRGREILKSIGLWTNTSRQVNSETIHQHLQLHVNLTKQCSILQKIISFHEKIQQRFFLFSSRAYFESGVTFRKAVWESTEPSYTEVFLAMASLRGEKRNVNRKYVSLGHLIWRLSKRRSGVTDGNRR